MPERALIIAIEQYSQVTGGFVAKELQGTLKAALDFRDWLLKKWEREGKSDGVIYLCSEPPQPGHRGSTRKDIVETLIQLEKDGVNKTDNLYVYFSGHGFRLANAREPLSDVLVSSDFIDTKLSADCCFKLDALIDGLRSSLGHGCHFYFIDACRNEVSKAIAGPPMPFDGEGDEEPSWFVLQSTVAGAPSLVGGLFASKLRDGLNGAGKAKVWDPPIVDSMKVRFDSLRRYVAEAVKKTQPITQKSGGEMGESDVVLATIRPIEPTTVTITLAGTPDVVKGKAIVTSFDGAQATHDIVGRTTTIALPPNHYSVEVAVDGVTLQPTGKVPFEAYENIALPPFSVVSSLEDADSAPPMTAAVQVAVPVDAEVVLRNADTGDEMLFSATRDADVPIGTYLSTLRRKNGQVIRRDEINVRSRFQRVDVSPANWRGVAASDSIAAKVPQTEGFIWLSESLGSPVSDPDLNVWLSIIGAGRAIGSTGEFEKIFDLPLTAKFSNEGPDASPIYVLAGFASDNVRLRAAINSAGAMPAWSEAVRPPDLPGVREMVLHPAAGQYFVTFAIDDQPTYTLATVTMPNRCTVIVLTLADDGGIRISQYIVPIGHLRDRLEPQVEQNYKGRVPLRDIYTLAQLTRAFRKRRRLEAEFKSSELDSLLWAKWLDPIGGALAAYELMRRRHNRQALIEVATNMERFFGALPDSTAIARVVRGDERPPTGVPLFLDGLRAFPDYPIWLPYEAGLLDFTGPWTAWRDAVPRPN